MNTHNFPQNVGHRQVYNSGLPQQRPFIPGNPFIAHQNGQRPPNPAYFQQQIPPPNATYHQYQQVIPQAPINEGAASPPSVASTPGPQPPPTNNGNPLQPGPAIYYNQIPQQQPRPSYMPQQQIVYVMSPPQAGQIRGPPPPQYIQRPQTPMQYSAVSQNYNVTARYPIPPQGIPPMEGQYFDPSMQQQQPRPPFQRNPNYQGRNQRGGRGGGGNNGGNSNQSSRRSSVRHDGRPDSTNKSPSQPSPPETHLPPFAEQNIPLQAGQIMQQNQMYAVAQMPPGAAMMPPQGQPTMYLQTSHENPMGQPQFYIMDPNQFQQQQYYMQPQMFIPQHPPPQMHQQQHHQQMHMEQHQHHLQPPPSLISQTSNEAIDLQEFAEAIKVIQQEEKLHHQSSPEKVKEDLESAAMPALDAASVQGDIDDYTPPGTPQSLNPLNEQQMNQLVESVNQELQHSQNEKMDERKRDESSRKRQQKPEQQHYQPPRAASGRPNAQRTNSWKSNASQPSNTHLSRINEEEKSKSPAQMQPTNLPSDTPTPRASPVADNKPSSKPKEAIHKSDVPMIGGVPLIPTIGGVPLISSASNEQVEISTPKEHCAYCDMLRKPIREITNHSLFSSRGVPACSAFREDGCKLCGQKGDSAHLVEFCKKYMNRSKENVDFKKMANYLFSMGSEERRAIVIKDMRNHPKVEAIESHPDERYKTACTKALKKVFVHQMRFTADDQKDYEDLVKFEEQQQRQQQNQRYYDERNYRGSRSGPRGGGGGGSGHFRGNTDRGGRGGGGGQSYSGSRSRDGGGSSGGRGSRGSGGGGGGRYDQQQQSRRGGGDVRGTSRRY